MTKNKIISAVLLLVVMFTTLSFPSVHASGTTENAKATWLWDVTSILNTKSKLSSTEKTNVSNLIAFCKQKGITDIYLQINRDVPKAKYQYLVSQLSAARVTIGANSLPILVQALDGSDTWITPDGDARRIAFFDWVTSYQTVAKTAQRFSGIHLDVEPYTNALWTSNQAAAILAYQNFVKDTLTRIATANAVGLNLGLMFDIPFWYDEITYNNSYGSGNIAEWMYQNVPAVAIMSYRDALDSNYGGMWSVSQTELAYSKTYGKKTVISGEVSLQDPTYISFYEEGQAAMLNVFAGMTTRIAGDTTTSGVNFGFAVHDYKNWKTMKP